MIEFQAYNKGKQVFHRSNLWWQDAFELLETKKGIEVDKIDVQLYTDDKERVMPVDDVEDLKSVEEAQRWINYVQGKIIKREYKGIEYDKR